VEVDGSPSIANGIAYVGTDDGTLLALDITNGQVLQSMVSQPYVIAGPAISDGVVYFNGEYNKTYAYALQAGIQQVRAPDIRNLSLHRNLQLRVTPAASQAATLGATAFDP
jgi:outer membrane protein assembly factor BamB